MVQISLIRFVNIQEVLQWQFYKIIWINSWLEMMYWTVIYLFCTHLTFDISETQKYFQTWHPPIRLLPHIKEYNKHGCQSLLNYAIKSENKPLLSKWTANYLEYIWKNQPYIPLVKS